jgi:hypothetical protein
VIRVARASLVWLAVAVATVLVVDLFSPEDGTVDADTILTVLGAAAVLQLLVALAGRWPGVWSRGDRFTLGRSARPIGTGRAADPAGQVEAVREWEALLVAGTTGAERGRERLARRVEPLTPPPARPLLDELRAVPSAHVLGVVERIATEVERTHDD